MSLNQKAAEILSDAERRLVSLATIALENRDYVVAQRLSALAGRVAAVNSVDGDDFQGSEKGFPQKQNAVTTPAPKAPFPQFFREENQLVKIGYSKSERRTYEHRCPREVLDRLANLLLTIGADGKQFNTERMLPPVEKSLADLPSYQVYLCLAFLVLSGLVKKHGRSGYTIASEHAGELATAVAEKWNQLPVR